MLTSSESPAKEGRKGRRNQIMGSSSMEELLSKQEEKEEERKWSGGVELTLDCPVKSAWALQSDFAGLHKWVPTVRKCELVEGENKKVGCLRYCIGNSWVYERLLEFDDHNMYMSYRMESNRFVFPKGFQGYVSKVRLRDDGEGKTFVSWTYSVNPVFSQTEEQLTKFMTALYTNTLKHLETAANLRSKL
ncbi:unnamed protein product [Sphagnum tenellum]